MYIIVITLNNNKSNGNNTLSLSLCFFQHVSSVPWLEADTHSADLTWRKRENRNYLRRFTSVSGRNTEHTTGKAPCNFRNVSE